MNNYREEFDVEKNPPPQLAPLAEMQADTVRTEETRPLLTIATICSLEDKPKLHEFLKHLPKLPGIEILICFTVPQVEERELGIRHLEDRHMIRFYNYTYDSFSFSEARNAVIRQARAEWILTLDVDEVIPQNQHRDLMAMVAEMPDTYDCFSCHVFSVIADPVERRYKSEVGVVPRLFRNRDDIYFKGHCHEFVIWSVAEERRGDCSLMICHNGYDADIDTLLFKLGRNIHLLARDLAETEPDDIRLPFIQEYLEASCIHKRQILQHRNQQHSTTN